MPVARTHGSFLAGITGGVMMLDKSLRENDDLPEVGWARMDEREKWERYTQDILHFYSGQTG